MNERKGGTICKICVYSTFDLELAAKVDQINVEVMGSERRKKANI